MIILETCKNLNMFINSSSLPVCVSEAMKHKTMSSIDEWLGQVKLTKCNIVPYVRVAAELDLAEQKR